MRRLRQTGFASMAVLEKEGERFPVMSNSCRENLHGIAVKELLQSVNSAAAPYFIWVI